MKDGQWSDCPGFRKRSHVFIKSFTRTSKWSTQRQEPTLFFCFSPRSKSSDDPIVPERLEQHSVLDVAEDPADAVGVCGAGKVRVESLPLLPVVAVDGLLLVQLADVVLGVLGVLPLTCHRDSETEVRDGSGQQKGKRWLEVWTTDETISQNMKMNQKLIW